MENPIVARIEQSRKERSQLHPRFLANAAAYRPFLEVEKHAFAQGSLSRKHKELIALAISIVTKCEPCMEWHTEQALKAGAVEAEFFETIDVAIEMGGGAAAAYARFALQAFDYYTMRSGECTEST